VNTDPQDMNASCTTEEAIAGLAAVLNMSTTLYGNTVLGHFSA